MYHRTTISRRVGAPSRKWCRSRVTRSRLTRNRFRLPLGGQPPRVSATLRSPREGGLPPSEPPFESRRGLAFDGVSCVIVPPSRDWCRSRDSNPDGLPHTPLKRACLPVPPLRHGGIIGRGSNGCQSTDPSVQLTNPIIQERFMPDSSSPHAVRSCPSQQRCCIFRRR